MTGYIKAFKPELKIKDYELYRGVYCSECRVLGRLYTPIARMLLSYDFTFLSIVRLALQEQCGKFEKGRCCVNPAKKCLKCTDDAELERSADVVIIVSYYKLLDDIEDGGFFKRLACRLIKPALSLMHKKAARRQEMLDRAVAAAMKEQEKIENPARRRSTRRRIRPVRCSPQYSLRDTTARTKYSCGVSAIFWAGGYICSTPLTISKRI